MSKHYKHAHQHNRIPTADVEIAWTCPNCRHRNTHTASRQKLDVWEACRGDTDWIHFEITCEHCGVIFFWDNYKD